MMKTAKRIVLCTAGELICWPALAASYVGVGLSKIAVWIVVGARRVSEAGSWLKIKGCE